MSGRGIENDMRYSKKEYTPRRQLSKTHHVFDVSIQAKFKEGQLQRFDFDMLRGLPLRNASFGVLHKPHAAVGTSRKRQTY